MKRSRSGPDLHELRKGVNLAVMEDSFFVNSFLAEAVIISHSLALVTLT